MRAAMKSFVALEIGGKGNVGRHRLAGREPRAVSGARA